MARWRVAGEAGDLGKMPRDMTSQVERHGTRGGVKLLPHGRKYANDFFKLALPDRFIIAVALREREDGTVEPGELELWLGLTDALHARRPDVAFVCSIASPRRNGGNGRHTYGLRATRA